MAGRGKPLFIQKLPWHMGGQLTAALREFGARYVPARIYSKPDGNYMDVHCYFPSPADKLAFRKDWEFVTGRHVPAQ